MSHLDKFAYILFTSIADAERVYQMVRDYLDAQPDTAGKERALRLQRRWLSQYATVQDLFEVLAGHWEFDVSPGYYQEDATLHASLRFPYEDVALVSAALDHARAQLVTTVRVP